MTNLLPPAAKKEIIIEYWMRVVCAWVILWSICLFLGVVLLWPTYVLLIGNNEAYAESANEATERTNEYKELSIVLTETSAKAKEIATVTDRPLMSKVVQDIFAVVDTNKIEITNIGVFREEKIITPLAVSGEAADRLALAQLRDSLEALSFVSSIDLPIDNLAKNEDISFSLTVILIHEEL